MPVRKISLEEAFNTKTFSANEEAFSLCVRLPGTDLHRRVS